MSVVRVAAPVPSLAGLVAAAVVVVSSAGGWVLGRWGAGLERESLRQLALRDPLTGLANRAGLQAAAAEAPVAGAGRVGVLLVDLDGFKPVNDTYGHEAGDRILAAAARRLAVVAGRWRGVAARIGGDEFAVLLPRLPADAPAAEAAALAVAAQAAAALSGVYVVAAGVGLQVGASVGVATGAGSAGLAGWLAAADMAMYAAKRAGGGVRCAPEPPGAAVGVAAGLVPAPRRPADRLRDAAAGEWSGVRR